MIVEASKNHHQMECPAVAVQGEKRKCPFATDLSNSGTETKPVSSASFVVPPHPPGWRSYPILGHAPQLFKMGEKGEMAPAMLKAFKMSPGDMSSLDIPGMSEGNGGVYFTSNADYAHIVSTDLEHWGNNHLNDYPPA